MNKLQADSPIVFYDIIIACPARLYPICVRSEALPVGKAVRYWSCPLSRNRARIIPQFHSGHKHVKEFCLRRHSNPRLHSYRAGALPAEPRQQMIYTHCQRFADCGRNATMRFTVNKNVALSASTITA